MPAVHYASRSFLAQLGVIDPPSTAIEIEPKLRRDLGYFRFTSKARQSPGEDANRQHGKGTCDASVEPNSASVGDAMENVDRGNCITTDMEHNVCSNHSSGSACGEQNVSPDPVMSSTNITLRKRRTPTGNEDFVWDAAGRFKGISFAASKLNGPLSGKTRPVSIRNEPTQKLAYNGDGAKRPISATMAKDDGEDMMRVGREAGENSGTTNGCSHGQSRGPDRCEENKLTELTNARELIHQWSLRVAQCLESEIAPSDTNSQLHHGANVDETSIGRGRGSVALSACTIVSTAQPAGSTKAVTTCTNTDCLGGAFGTSNTAIDTLKNINERTRTMAPKSFGRQPRLPSDVKMPASRKMSCKRKFDGITLPSGIFAYSSGKRLKIEMGYQGKNRAFGSFRTLEQALAANRAVRSMLTPTKNQPNLAASEIESNVNRGKQKALEAASDKTALKAAADIVSELRRAEISAEESLLGTKNAHEILSQYKAESGCNGPNLLPCQLQTEIIFKVWLEDRKIKWRQQRRRAHGPKTCLNVNSNCRKGRVSEDTISSLSYDQLVSLRKDAASSDSSSQLSLRHSILSVMLTQKDSGDVRHQWTPRFLQGALIKPVDKSISKNAPNSSSNNEINSQQLHSNNPSLLNAPQITAPGTKNACILVHKAGSQITPASEAASLNLSINKQGLSEEAKSYLTSWVSEHSSYPYPTREEKNLMMSMFGIKDERKLEGWFCRARKKRDQVPGCMSEHKKGLDTHHLFLPMKSGRSSGSMIPQHSDNTYPLTLCSKYYYQAQLGGCGPPVPKLAINQQTPIQTNSHPNCFQRSQRLQQCLDHRMKTYYAPPDTPWFYIDTKGAVQGPFQTYKMKGWFEYGYLQNDLLIRRGYNGPFQALSSIFSDQDKAFT